MSRKLILAFAAAATLTAMAPVTASADWHGGWRGHDGPRGGWGHHHVAGGPFFVAPPVRVFSSPVYSGYDGCLRRRMVPTPFGWRWRTVNVCAY